MTPTKHQWKLILTKALALKYEEEKRQGAFDAFTSVISEDWTMHFNSKLVTSFCEAMDMLFTSRDESVSESIYYFIYEAPEIKGKATCVRNGTKYNGKNMTEYINFLTAE